MTLLVLFWTVSATLAAQEPESLNPADKALIQSAYDGELTRVQGLVKKGAAIDKADEKGRTAMMWAAFRGHTEVVEFLARQGANINAQDNRGRSVLIYACIGSRPQIAEVLLNNGAEIDLQSAQTGATALMVAAAAGNLNMVRLLLSHGADTSLEDKEGATAHAHAKLYGHATVVELLENPPAPAGDS